MNQETREAALRFLDQVGPCNPQDDHGNCMNHGWWEFMSDQPCPVWWLRRYVDEECPEWEDSKVEGAHWLIAQVIYDEDPDDSILSQRNVGSGMPVPSYRKFPRE